MAVISFTLERRANSSVPWSQWAGFPDGSGGTTAVIQTANDGSLDWEIPADLDPTYQWRIVSSVQGQQMSAVEFDVYDRGETELLGTPLSAEDVQILNFGDQIRMANGKDDAPSIYLNIDRNFFWGDISTSSVMADEFVGSDYTYTFTPNTTNFPNPNNSGNNLHIAERHVCVEIIKVSVDGEEISQDSSQFVYEVNDLGKPTCNVVVKSLYDQFNSKDISIEYKYAPIAGYSDMYYDISRPRTSGADVYTSLAVSIESVEDTNRIYVNAPGMDLQDNTYYYKIVPIYDGLQEPNLDDFPVVETSNVSAVINTSDVNGVQVEIEKFIRFKLDIDYLNPRITSFNVYRATNFDGPYYKVSSVSTLGRTKDPNATTSDKAYIGGVTYLPGISLEVNDLIMIDGYVCYVSEVVADQVYKFKKHSDDSVFNPEFTVFNVNTGKEQFVNIGHTHGCTKTYQYSADDKSSKALHGLIDQTQKYEWATDFTGGTDYNGFASPKFFPLNYETRTESIPKRHFDKAGWYIPNFKKTDSSTVLYNNFETSIDNWSIHNITLDTSQSHPYNNAVYAHPDKFFKDITIGSTTVAPSQQAHLWMTGIAQANGLDDGSSGTIGFLNDGSNKTTDLSGNTSGANKKWASRWCMNTVQNWEKNTSGDTCIENIEKSSSGGPADGMGYIKLLGYKGATGSSFGSDSGDVMAYTVIGRTFSDGDLNNRNWTNSTTSEDTGKWIGGLNSSIIGEMSTSTSVDDTLVPYLDPTKAYLLSCWIRIDTEFSYSVGGGGTPDSAGAWLGTAGPMGTGYGTAQNGPPFGGSFVNIGAYNGWTANDTDNTDHEQDKINGAPYVTPTGDNRQFFHGQVSGGFYDMGQGGAGGQFLSSGYSPNSDWWNGYCSKGGTDKYNSMTWNPLWCVGGAFTDGLTTAMSETTNTSGGDYEDGNVYGSFHGTEHAKANDTIVHGNTPDYSKENIVTGGTEFNNGKWMHLQKVIRFAQEDSSDKVSAESRPIVMPEEGGFVYFCVQNKQQMWEKPSGVYTWAEKDIYISGLSLVEIKTDDLTGTETKHSVTRKEFNANGGSIPYYYTDQTVEYPKNLRPLSSNPNKTISPMVTASSATESDVIITEDLQLDTMNAKQGNLVVVAPKETGIFEEEKDSSEVLSSRVRTTKTKAILLEDKLKNGTNRTVVNAGEPLKLSMAKDYKWTNITDADGNYGARLTYEDRNIPNGALHPFSETSIVTNYEHAKFISGRMFVANVKITSDTVTESHDDFVMYSELGQPDVIPITNYIQIQDFEGAKILAIEELLGNLVVFVEKGVFLVQIPKDDPVSWSLMEAEKSIGLVAKDSIVNWENNLFFAGQDNLYMMTSNFDAQPITTSIRDDYQAYNNSKTACHFDVKKERLLMVLGGLTSHIYALDLKDIRQGKESWSRISLGGQNSVEAFTTDENFKVYAIRTSDTTNYEALGTVVTKDIDGPSHKLTFLRSQGMDKLKNYTHMNTVVSGSNVFIDTDPKPFTYSYAYDETAQEIIDTFTFSATTDFHASRQAGVANNINVAYYGTNVSLSTEIIDSADTAIYDLVPDNIGDTLEAVGFNRKTGWIKKADIRQNVYLRRFNIKYKSNVELSLKIYTDNDESTVAKTITIPSSINVVEMKSFRVGKRFKTLQLELCADKSIGPDIEIYRMEIELDD